MYPTLISAPSPASSSHASPSPATSRPASAKPGQKPANVFSNDGSFLERFQRTKREEDEKKKQQEALERKRNFDNRFKKRGKRPLPEDSADNSSSPTAQADDAISNKKLKTAEERSTTEYEKQMKSYTGHILKEGGMGVRPLVK